MSTQRTDNDAKRMGGYLKEKWTIGMSRVSSDELQRALIKVTSHKLKVPNEKHLERLISATHGNINTGSNQYDDVPGYIVTELEGHTHSRNWVVVLKTLIVYHELMNQGSDKMLQAIASHRQPFNTAHMKDLADSPDGAMQEGFVHAYARYLEERCVTIASCRLQTRIESEEFLQHYLEISAASAAPVTAALLLQLEVLLNVDLRESALNNHATMHAFKRVVEDGRRLYAVLTRRMAAMLEGFVGYPHPDKKSWLQLFTRYQQATKKLADLFARMNALPSIDFGSQLPTLKTMPDSIIVQLENYMLDSDDSGASNVTVSRLERGGTDGTGESGGGGVTRSKSPELFKRKLASGGSQSPQASSPFAIAGAPAAPQAAVAAGASGLSASATAPASMAQQQQQQQQQPTKADPLGDLFGSESAPPQPARTVATPPPAGAGLATHSAPAAQPQQAGNTMDDLFAPAAVTKQAAPLPPQQQQPRPAASTSTVADFDPFAPAPASQWQSASPPPAAAATRSPPPPQAAGTGGGSMDFFATGAQPQQQSAGTQQQRRPNTDAKSHGDDQLDFFAASSGKPAPTGNGKARAW